jgi:hypothetical protein
MCSFLDEFNNKIEKRERSSTSDKRLGLNQGSWAITDLRFGTQLRHMIKVNESAFVGVRRTGTFLRKLRLEGKAKDIDDS